MIPKVETCIEAIEAGVQGVVILNGKTSHSVLLELSANRARHADRALREHYLTEYQKAADCSAAFSV